jgi:hypothetical protein
MLPCDQISEGQRGPTELLIKPNAEIMQCHLGHQTCLEPIQRMGAFAIKSKCMLQMGADGLHNLADARSPPSP